MYYDQNLDYFEISFKSAIERNDVKVDDELIEIRDGEELIGYGFYNAKENLKSTQLLKEDARKQALKFIDILKKWRV